VVVAVAAAVAVAIGNHNHANVVHPTRSLRRAGFLFVM